MPPRLSTPHRSVTPLSSPGAVWMALALAACLLASPAVAQGPVLRLDDSGGWNQQSAPEPGSDEATLAEARRLIAEGEPGRARKLISRWLKENQRSDNPWLAEAYLIRGDARNADGSEYLALYDYEVIIKDFAATPQYTPALEREFDIAVRYLNGLRRKLLGIRIEDARTVGEELLIRVQERLPGSRLAEEAAITLADHYYRRRDLELAGEMYGIFVNNYPRSEFRRHAMLRQIYANIAQYKGPRYDAALLTESRLLIDQFRLEFPAEAQASGVSEALLIRIDESEARGMLTRARWYLGQGDGPAARLLLERLNATHAASSAAEDARRLLDEYGWADLASAGSPSPEPAPEPDTVPADAVPADAVPADTVPADTVPADAVPPADATPSDGAEPRP